MRCTLKLLYIGLQENWSLGSSFYARRIVGGERGVSWLWSSLISKKGGEIRHLPCKGPTILVYCAASHQLLICQS